VSTDPGDQLAAVAGRVDLVTGGGEVQTQTTVFPDVAVWVHQWLAPSLSMHVTGDGRGRVFCPQWWDHDAVVVRLAALWEAWEKAVVDKATSTWWVQHADPHLRAMCDGETGPMRRCTEHRHVPTRTLTVLPVPAGWLDQSASRGPDFRRAFGL
jgi:hypothetical protein